ncbi:MAG: aminoacyl-tRNA hydrolase [Bacteroidales bacterium]
MKYLIAGLGNIGPQYAGTRHNAGFDIVEQVAAKKDAVFESGRYAWHTRIRFKGRELVLIKPTTFMNLSGKAVRYWLEKEKIAVENLLVIVDDLALPPGELRLKKKGGAGSHNGLEDIIAVLGTEEFARIRFGIGDQFVRGYQANYVLSPWEEEELPAISERMKVAADMVISYVTIGAERTMTLFNKK